MSLFFLLKRIKKIIQVILLKVNFKDSDITTISIKKQNDITYLINFFIHFKHLNSPKVDDLTQFAVM